MFEPLTGGELVVARDAVAMRGTYGDDLAVVGDLGFALGNGGDTVRLLTFEVWVHKDTHGGRKMIDAIKLALFKCPEVPQAREHLLDRLRQMSFVGAMRVRTV